MGEIEDALDRAGQEQFTREPLKTVKGRVDFTVRQLGTTRGDGTTATINELSRCGFGRAAGRAEVPSMVIMDSRTCTPPESRHGRAMPEDRYAGGVMTSGLRRR
ncbi:hypothetical protein ABZ490_51845 [Streptomyces sp. NPDC005811]|uniref:hypothetical protein n=1 Tax=Streptomyces sp. NPDC005811 TaxID=3154565 RepID=UPI0033DD6E17